jgi:hypothetical protein
MSENEIKIELSNSEALVLFELVSRFSDDEKLEIKDPAEERVLWSICCQLESVLVEPFRSNYGELLAEASKEVLKEG